MEIEHSQMERLGWLIRDIDKTGQFHSPSQCDVAVRLSRTLQYARFCCFSSQTTRTMAAPCLGQIVFVSCLEQIEDFARTYICSTLIVELCCCAKLRTSVCEWTSERLFLLWRIHFLGQFQDFCTTFVSWFGNSWYPLRRKKGTVNRTHFVWGTAWNVIESLCSRPESYGPFWKEQFCTTEVRMSQGRILPKPELLILAILILALFWPLRKKNCSLFTGFARLARFSFWALFDKPTHLTGAGPGPGYAVVGAGWSGPESARKRTCTRTVEIAVESFSTFVNSDPDCSFLSFCFACLPKASQLITFGGGQKVWIKGQFVPKRVQSRWWRCGKTAVTWLGNSILTRQMQDAGFSSTFSWSSARRNSSQTYPNLMQNRTFSDRHPATDRGTSRSRISCQTQITSPLLWDITRR